MKSLVIVYGWKSAENNTNKLEEAVSANWLFSSCMLDYGMTKDLEKVRWATFGSKAEGKKILLVPIKPVL